MIDAEGLAHRLLGEHARGARFQPFAAAAGARGIDDAYAIQDRFVSLLQADHGAPVGYKIGLTSKRMQAMCGIDQPIAGVVLADRVHRSGARVALGDYGRLGLEFEIAVRMAADLPAEEGASLSIESVARHVDGVAAAIEIVDDRAADYAVLDVLSLVADNSWNGGIVLSEFQKPWPALDAALGIVTRHGAEVDRGHGRDVLGHPFAALAWLAGHLARHGRSLKAGDIVMTGSLVTTRFPTGPEDYSFSVEGLGSVMLSVAAGASA
jgi:2-keto-4-pentenoate hydratase